MREIRTSRFPHQKFFLNIEHRPHFETKLEANEDPQHSPNHINAQIFELAENKMLKKAALLLLHHICLDPIVLTLNNVSDPTKS